MDMTLRWYGKKQDSVTLEQIRQIPGVTGVISALHELPAGEPWPYEQVMALKKEVEAAGLKLLGIESINVHEDIKLGAPARDTLIKNYIASLESVGRADIHLVCYNFMPIFDWTRTDLAFPLPDGSNALAYDKTVIEGIRPVSYTVTPLVKADFGDASLTPKHTMGKAARLLYERYKNGAAPIAMVSMDNCSHNGDKLKAAVTAYAAAWVENGLVDAGFSEYVNNPDKVSFPWSMIDKITPRPDAVVQELLKKDGFEDTELIITGRNTYTAPFVNAEETEYLVIEDAFPNGKLPLDAAGIYYTDRETVDKVEKMKVCTCLNPLHTALAIFGCLMSYTTIHDEMEDALLRGLVTRMGYEEGMPVVVNPGILKPEDFIGAVLNKRLPNVFMPDTPQRIATDTSQKLPIRFGETLKAYLAKGQKLGELTFIPLVLAGYLRYLLGINDDGNAFEPSPDPMLGELREAMKDVAFGQIVPQKTFDGILSRKDLFAVDLVENGLSAKITAYFNELNAQPGAVRETLKRVLG